MTQILDCEASGLHADSYPIQIGVYDIDHPINSFERLIRPVDEWTYWCPNAERIHNIPRYAIEERGYSVQQVARLLNDNIRGVCYSDAPGWERFWIDRLMLAAGAARQFTIRSVYTLIDPRQHGAMIAALDAIQMPHKALQDAEIIGKVVRRFMG